MQPATPIFLAYGDSSVWDAIIWLVAGVFWLFIQIANANKQKQKKSRQSQPPPPAAFTSSSSGGDSPTPGELAEIFKRLGADIPDTPPPAPRPVPPPAPRLARKSPAPPIVKPRAAEQIQPELARRLAKAKQEAAEAAIRAEAERIAVNAIVHGVQSRGGETRALDTATRHTGTILPRLYAMSMRLAPLPQVPMPGLDRTHHVVAPMRTRLHARREVRDALIAQTFLQPPKSFAR
jgi:hypothetical protein